MFIINNSQLNKSNSLPLTNLNNHIDSHHYLSSLSGLASCFSIYLLIPSRIFLLSFNFSCSKLFYCFTCLYMMSRLSLQLWQMYYVKRHEYIS